MAAKRAKWSEAQIKAHIQKIQKVIDQGKRENKGEHFIGITPEEIRKKFKRVNSPMIVFQGWNSTSLGGTVNLNVGIYNPDPTEAIWLFAHVWVGSGNIDPTVGTFLLNVDTRFPRLTEPPFFGLTLAAGASATLSYALKVPSTIEKSNYLGNTCLMQFNWFDVGLDLERAAFVFTVS
jgi:hypothetical protein